MLHDTIPQTTPDKIRTVKAEDLIRYKKITCHIIFDGKKDFTMEAMFVANVAITAAIESLTWPSAVARDSVKLAFLIAALNDLDIISCVIRSIY